MLVASLVGGTASSRAADTTADVPDYLDSNYSLDTKKSKYNSCGQNCKYERASEVASQKAAYESGKAAMVSSAIEAADLPGSSGNEVQEALQDYAPRDFIDTVCEGREDRECAERFVEYEANHIRNARKAVNVSETMILKLKSKESADLTSPGNVTSQAVVTRLGVFPSIQYKNDKPKMAQVSRFKTVKDLRDTANGNLGDLSLTGRAATANGMNPQRVALDIYQAEDFSNLIATPADSPLAANAPGAADEAMLVEPSPEDYTLFEKVDPNDPDNQEERLVMDCGSQKRSGGCECRAVGSDPTKGFERAFCFKKDAFEAAHRKWRIAMGKEAAPANESHRLRSTLERLTAAAKKLTNGKTKRDAGTLNPSKDSVPSERLTLFREVVGGFTNHSQKLYEKVRQQQAGGSSNGSSNKVAGAPNGGSATGTTTGRAPGATTPSSPGSSASNGYGSNPPSQAQDMSQRVKGDTASAPKPTNPAALDEYTPPEGDPGDANTHISYDPDAIDDSLKQFEAKTKLKL